jgi:hypothetical protein
MYIYGCCIHVFIERILDIGAKSTQNASTDSVLCTYATVAVAQLVVILHVSVLYSEPSNSPILRRTSSQRNQTRICSK